MPRIGLVTVRGADYPPTRRLTEAAQIRGADIAVLHPYQQLTGIQNDRNSLSGLAAQAPVDAVLPRQGAEIKSACLPLIAHFEQTGIPVINGLQAIMTVRHKFMAMQAFMAAGLSVADTIYVGDHTAYRTAVQKLAPGPVVVKPIRGRQGTGIACLGPDDLLPRVLQAELDQGNGLLVQVYVAPATRRDLRVMVIGDQVAGAMALTPVDGEFRANIHLGGRSRPLTPSPRVISTALKAARAVGLEVAGIDLMQLDDDTLLVVEANYSPGFRGLEKSTGLDIAGWIIDHVLSRVRQVNQLK